MTLTRKSNPIQHPPLFLNNMMIQETPTHRHLGLTFSDSCDWNVHVKNMSEKAWTRLNLLRALKFRASRTSLEKIYMAFVRPLLEYNDAVWDNCSLETKKQLDAIHVKAARIITGATKLCSIEKPFLSWMGVSSKSSK